MKEDTVNWDVFKDAHKFERRDRIQEKRKKKQIEEELKAMRSDRETSENQSSIQTLNNKIELLHVKISQKDKIIDKRIAKEDELTDIIKEKDEKLILKDREIQKLNATAYQMEVLQGKFEQKEVEIESLLTRLGIMATEYQMM
jgi:hypothetical protein